MQKPRKIVASMAKGIRAINRENYVFLVNSYDKFIQLKNQQTNYSSIAGHPVLCSAGMEKTKSENTIEAIFPITQYKLVTI